MCLFVGIWYYVVGVGEGRQAEKSPFFFLGGVPVVEDAPAILQAGPQWDQSASQARFQGKLL